MVFCSRYPIIGFLGLWLLVGCTQKVVPSPLPSQSTQADQSMNTVLTPPLPPFSWETTWLTAEMCPVSCWEGLIPGTSTMTDALNLIHSWEEVEDVVMYEEMNPEYSDLGFFWYTSDERASGDIYTYPTSSTIQFISVDLSHPISFERITPKFGSPSHVQATRHTTLDEEATGDGSDPVYQTTYEVNLFYQDHGLILKTNLMSTEPQINETLMIHTFQMTVPGHTPMNSSDIEAPILPWEEGKPFSWYCYDSPMFQPCTD